MAKKKAPNPYADFVKMFDPANVSKAFDPAAIMEQFGLKAGAFDPEEIAKKAKSQFEAMSKANEAAAQSYRGLIEKQMEIFETLTSEAAAKAKDGMPENGSAAYQEAVSRALELMTELSDAARDANTQAYDAIKGRVDAAIKDLKS